MALLLLISRQFCRPTLYSSVLFFPVLLGLFSGCKPAENSHGKTSEIVQDSPLFELVPSTHSGIEFQNFLPENDQFNILSYEYYYNGGGVAIGDVNSDGLPDIIFTANLVANRLYLNKGNLHFEDASIANGFVSRPGWKTGVTLTDINHDGAPDIYVCRSGNLDEEGRANELFINIGDGTFVEKAAQYGLNDPGYSTHASFFDYDLDGDLDMFLLNHSLKPDFSLTVARVKDQRHPYFGDKLFRNDGTSFTDVSEQAGIKGNPIGFGLSVSTGDINQDGWPDIFVANDYTEQDYLYINNHDGTFSDRLDSSFVHTSHFSMGSDLADINNDGLPELMVLDMLPEDNYGQKILKGPDNYDRYQLQVTMGFYHQQMRNNLQLNLGNGKFSEIGQLAGVSNTDWSWSALLADFDLDGDKDLHITNGYYRASTHLDFVKYTYPQTLEAAQKSGKQLGDGEVSKQMPTIHTSNYIFRNEGNLTFSDQTQSWGLKRPSYSNGAAYGDLDLDGDLDLVVNNLMEEAFIYRNLAADQKRGNYLRIRLRGEGKNTSGIGSRVWVSSPASTQYQEMNPVRGFQSSVENILHFGLGQDNSARELKIVWPSGKLQVLSNVPANQVITLNEKDAVLQAPDTEQEGKPAIFTETGLPGLSYRHLEDDFVDFRSQPLIPHMVSRMGPCLAVADFNGDQTEDIFIGSAAGQSSDIYLQSSSDKFQVITLEGAQFEDNDAVVFDLEGDGDMDVYVASGGNSFPENDPRYQDRIYENNQGTFTMRTDLLPKDFSSTGCLSAADVDGDGDTDIFTGGWVVPGKYPFSQSSRLLINEGGKLVDQTAAFAPDLQRAGIISDAIWADINNDQKPDLIIAGEWTPVRVLINTGQKLEEKTTSWFPDHNTGWWNSLLAEDFDGDGDIDLVAGNLGLNAQIKASPKFSASVYAKDFDGNGSVDPIISYFIQEKEYPVATRDELLSQLNFLKKKYIRYEEYARATTPEILGPELLKDAFYAQAEDFNSSYFENLGNGSFRKIPLPIETQVAPVMDMLSIDFNQDGKKELLLAGNFYPVRAETGSFDAGYGCLLTYEGKGNFSTIPLSESGFYASGDVRELILLRLADQSRVIIVGKNNQPLQFFHIGKTM